MQIDTFALALTSSILLVRFAAVTHLVKADGKSLCGWKIAEPQKNLPEGHLEKRERLQFAFLPRCGNCFALEELIEIPPAVGVAAPAMYSSESTIQTSRLERPIDPRSRGAIEATSTPSHFSRTATVRVHRTATYRRPFVVSF